MKHVIKFIIFSLILSIIINIIYCKFIKKSEINQLFGYSCLKVLTGSMEPEIKAGENIIIKKSNDYKIGDIITFITKDGEIITHRIVSIENENYYTKGDYNNAQDIEPITINQIYGKVIFHFSSLLPNNNISFAKYFNLNKKILTAKIAKPIFIVNGDNEILIEKYGSINDYNFIIRNYDGNDVSEVSLDYNIEVIADKKIEYKLFCDDVLVDINNIFTMSHSTPIEHKYLLKIVVPDNYLGTFKINICAYQKKEGIN